MNVGVSTNDEDMCLIDRATTRTILKSNNFSLLWLSEKSMLVLSIILQIYLKALEDLLYFY